MAKPLDISTDGALKPSNALQKDGLARGAFAQATVDALRVVSSNAGFVISLEGPWGSGKTSMFAMIEQLLRQEPEQDAVIVHFNPWLIGDRDGLLRQFLASISHAIFLGDKGKEARKVAKELRNYSKAFDLVKFIPGAEPWATIIQSVVKGASDAADGFGAQKELDLEERKRAVEKALAAFGKNIYVFIDDVDRLYPEEVFEMVRIIKSVGELPGIGYLVAWDPDYVRRALRSAHVPHASTYLDKIVQVRLPIPAISWQLRAKLFEEALKSADPLAFDEHFPYQRRRFQQLYVSGLSDLLEQPRDITRVVNTFKVIEPSLRGEIVPADILGLACLMVRAPRVYTALRKDPHPFVIEISDQEGNERKQKHKASMDKLFDRSPNADAVRRLVHHLFPAAAQASGGHSHIRSSEVEGHVAAPGRLGIALGMSIGQSDVSIADARRYLLDATSRQKINAKLTTENIYGFMDILGKTRAALPIGWVKDKVTLCQDVAMLIDQPTLKWDREVLRRSPLSIEDSCLKAIESIAAGETPNIAGQVADAIVRNPRALTIASLIITNTIDQSVAKHPYSIVLSKPQLKGAAERFTASVEASVSRGALWVLRSPGRILNAVTSANVKGTKSVFAALKKQDPSLDLFATHFFESGYSSAHGVSFSVRSYLCTEKFISLNSLRAHARQRLKHELPRDVTMAWRSVAEDQSFYIDGEKGRW